MNATVTKSSPIIRSARVMQLEGLFDVAPCDRSEVNWEHVLPIEERAWSVGLIVGPSGSGKSSLVREMFPKHVVSGYEWPADRSVVDAFPAGMPIKDITALLSNVGFSSPPSWMRPFGVLSTGEQFRVTVARGLAENMGRLLVIDEFTSVVDRTVAQIGSCAIAKTVRRNADQQFIAVTCHYDVLDWLQPDWVYDPSTGRFQWRELQPRPGIELTISRVHHSAWRIFAKHHYLTRELNHAAICFVAFIGSIPVAFHSYLPFVGRLPGGRKAFRGHRSVCLPDYQGVGIGNALITYLAGMWKGLGYRVFRNTGHPAEIASAQKSTAWKMISSPQRRRKDTVGTKVAFAKTRATSRLVAGFEFIGAGLDPAAATECLNSWGRMAA